MNRLPERLLFIASAVATALPLSFLLLFVVSAMIAVTKLDLSSLGPAAAGSAGLIILTALLSSPIAIALAIYLEEYQPAGSGARACNLMVSGLLGLPSAIYGLFGLVFFVRALALGAGLWAGALTLAVLLLPAQVVVTREALRSVPNTVREAALALGSTRWEMLRQTVLPIAVPGIMTGIILSLARAIGETASLVVLGLAINAAIPLRIFYGLTAGEPTLRATASAAVLALFLLLLLVNGLAIFLRTRHQARIQL